jgi:acetyl-CoA C-acetyltransferase
VFRDISAVDLGVAVVSDILTETKICGCAIGEVIIGNILGAGLGQNVARQVSIKSGIPASVPAFTINHVCGSGMKAIELATQKILLGECNIALAGGIENMSQVPYIARDFRWGAKMGEKAFTDMMISDGLTDVFNNYHMGITAENLAEKYNISREAQDNFAAQSQQKAEKAMLEGKFVDEITKISIPQRKGDPLVIDTDEYPKKGQTAESLSKLRPAFKSDGTVTAGNASGINDGAAMLLLMDAETADELGLVPLATIVNFATAGVDPSIMGYGPVPAIKNVLEKSNWNIADIELAELNEAFAAQSLAVLHGLETEVGKLNPDIVNVNGGAIALGHPIGASGTRIMVTLLHEMKKRGVKKGLASLCIGGGMGIAVCLENRV